MVTVCYRSSEMERAALWSMPRRGWWGFPGGSMVNNPSASAEDTGSIPGSGRSPGKGNGYPFQYSCLGNPKDRGAWWATVHGVTQESDMT